MLGALASLLRTIFPALALAALAAATVTVWTHWALRAGKLEPNSGFVRTVRRLTDPLLEPIEGSLVRVGRNREEAPLWLLGAVVLGGILAITLIGWVFGFLFRLSTLIYQGPGAWLLFLADTALNLLMLALLVRVIGSWLGAATTGLLMRAAHRLSDWLVDPIRRRLPPFGPFDLSPMVAYLALLLFRSMLFALI